MNVITTSKGSVSVDKPIGDQDKSPSIVNVPNALTASRLIGSGFLVALALYGNMTAFVILFAVLVVTDWIDGKVAILLNQRTEFGARLDSAADAVLYSTLLFSFCWLKWDFVTQQGAWILAFVFSYMASIATSLIKFKRMPSYHTWAAKINWHLLNIAIICIFGGWAIWPFHLTMAVVILVNLEAVCITLVLTRCHVDVRTLYHAIKLRTSDA